MRIVNKVNEPISNLFQEGRPVRSVEFFPPKDETGWQQFERTAEEIVAIQPDFVSITYGAGGTTQSRTLKGAAVLKNRYGLLTMPHLTCVGASQEELKELARSLYEEGYRNIMTLRGDPPGGETDFKPHPDGLRYASDLVTLLKEIHPDFCLGVAGYPEKHPEAPDHNSDIRNLKVKVDNGADFVTTQLFFDNEHYFDFVRRCREAGITVPIVPGIMPVLSLKQIRRFTEMCGATLPPALVERLEKVQDEPAKVQAAGREWAAEQIEDLLKRGAPGYHLYILNRSKAALALVEALHGF